MYTFHFQLNSTTQSVDHQVPTSGRFLPHRNSLFNRPSARHRPQKMQRVNGWTAQFVCLADKDRQNVPTAIEKGILLDAGLGHKKIKLDDKDDEEGVIGKITSGVINDNNEANGFPKLKEAGGFEMMRTIQNNRNLAVIDGSWSSKELKAKVGPQARIYLRPIQNNLSTRPLGFRQEHRVKVKCQNCNNDFFQHEVRAHLETCSGNSVLPESQPISQNTGIVP